MTYVLRFSEDLQRGGSPTAYDRILASRLGAAAIDALLDDQRNVMIGVKNEEVVYVPFTKAIKNDKPINQELLSTPAGFPFKCVSGKWLNAWRDITVYVDRLRKSEALLSDFWQDCGQRSCQSP